MGSSHASRHYVPNIMEKELNMTCYNAGVEGQRLIFHCALQKMILKRHKPKFIILNIDEDWLFESEEAYERLAGLHPYYWDYRTELEPILSLHSKFNTFKLLFRSYQTNSTIVYILKYSFIPQKDCKGHRPLNQQMEKILPRRIEITKEKIQKIDTSFVNIFEDFINNALLNDVNLIFTTSPHLYGLKVNKSLELMKSMAFEHGIPWFDFSDDRTFIE